jgi:hypothetical protein
VPSPARIVVIVGLSTGLDGHSYLGGIHLCAGEKLSIPFFSITLSTLARDRTPGPCRRRALRASLTPIAPTAGAVGLVGFDSAAEWFSAEEDL